MMQKARYYEALEDGWYAIYDQPYADKSTSVSVVQDLSYYRNTFNLRKFWGKVAPQQWWHQCYMRNMLQKSICSPGPGYGIIQFVAGEVYCESNGRTIVVLTGLPELRAQWKRSLPNAVYCSTVKADREPGNFKGCLVILHAKGVTNTLLQSLHELEAEVWLVDFPLAKALKRVTS